MKYFFTLVFILITVGCNTQNQEEQKFSYSRPTKVYRMSKHLFQIIEDDKIGFIDYTGQVVIQPQFLSAGEFSEGLASARTNGLYGFIDETGKFVIEPQFDYATEFSEGLAVVYKDALPFVINTDGYKVFECSYAVIDKFQNGRAKVKTNSNKFGMIDKHGRLFIDTVYSKIRTFVEGLAVVEGLNNKITSYYEDKYASKNEIGVIDSIGNVIIPYNKYSNLEDFHEGCFKAKIVINQKNKLYSNTAFLDRTGKTVLLIQNNSKYSVDGDFHCGLARIHFYKPRIHYIKKIKYDYDIGYDGFINKNGEIVINNPNYKSAGDFSNNRAFVCGNNSTNYRIINTQGKLVSKKVFSDVNGDSRYKEGFRNGVAPVLEGLWGVIDTNGSYIFKPQFRALNIPLVRSENYLFFTENYMDTVYHNSMGIAKTDGSILIRPIMRPFIKEGFKNGLLKCIIENKPTYINTSAQIVWKGKVIDDEYEHIEDYNSNIDFMAHGHFEASSFPRKYESRNIWGELTVFPKKLPVESDFPKNIFSINVRNEFKGIYTTSKKEYDVYVVNNTNSNILFNTQEGRLYMKVQALNPKGEWKDIQYLTDDWCGLSYYKSVLKSKHYWKFVTPRYEGTFKTKLRIELKYIDPSDDSKGNIGKKEVTIYSNEYYGSINPGQLWRKRGNYSNTVMEPNND